MDFKQIKELIKLVDSSNISEVKIKEGEFNISIRTSNYAQVVAAPVQAVAAPAVPAAAPAPAAAAPAAAPAPAADSAAGGDADDTDGQVEFKSPMIGTFYRKSSPEADVFASVGDSIKTGDVVCIIEAMKLFNEIEFEGEGTITKFLVEDSQPVEYDQPLFLYKPA